MNSNTFQDQVNQPQSYKYGSLTHPDAAVRRQSVEHNVECIELGQKIGSKAHTVWIGDGGNFPGQQHFRRVLELYLDSMRDIYRALPQGWRLFIEHKLYEPAFYSTVINDWGTSYYCVRELGERAFSLVDLGLSLVRYGKPEWFELIVNVMLEAFIVMPHRPSEGYK